MHVCVCPVHIGYTFPPLSSSSSTNIESYGGFISTRHRLCLISVNFSSFPCIHDPPSVSLPCVPVHQLALIQLSLFLSIYPSLHLSIYLSINFFPSSLYVNMLVHFYAPTPSLPVFASVYLSRCRWHLPWSFVTSLPAFHSTPRCTDSPIVSLWYTFS